MIDQWKSYLVLDKGFKQGIAAQDELSSADGDLIRVVHADSDYAVAVPVLMQSSSKHFSKVSNNTRQAMNKPSFGGRCADLSRRIERFNRTNFFWCSGWASLIYFNTSESAL